MSVDNIKISVLLTCHNRQEKTKKCLESLGEAVSNYNVNCHNKENQLSIEIFLTDDACTDDTVNVAYKVVSRFAPLHVITGDGNLYWAGGMRVAWGEAKKRHNEWKYYLLINDDVELLPNVFTELFNAQKYAVDHYGKEGIVSGITCDKNNLEKETYGGSVYTNKFLGVKRRVEPNGKPQSCDLTNANILLVPAVVVDKIGILDKRFRHGGDYDYTNRAKRKGWPLILTAQFCGKCEYDHRDKMAEKEKVLSMNLKERIRYYQHPTRCIHDQILGEWTKTPWRVPFVWAGRMMNMLTPRIYYWLDSIRNNMD